MGVRSKFRSRGTTATSMSDKDFGHLRRGRHIHMNGHSDFGILNYFGASSIFIRLLADTASSVFPAHPGNFAKKHPLLWEQSFARLTNLVL